MSRKTTRAAAGSVLALVVFAPAGQAQGTPAPAADTETIGEVVVTGRRAALENATERKRISESIIDSVVADEAGMLPDNSLTEVLQRVSGVTIVRFASLGDPDHFSAEGSGVQVRGLSGVGGRLNGREIFSASGGRGLSWGDVTPELMASVDVYKSATADLIEGGTGGQIDLRTKMPFDYDGDFALNVSANLNYGDMSEKTSPGVSALITDTWELGGGRFGVLLDVAVNEYAANADFFRMEPFYRTRVGTEDRFIPGGFDYGNDAFVRERQGVYLGMQWEPNESFRLSQTVFYSKYDEKRTGNGIFATSQALAVDPTTSEFDDDGFLLRSDRVFQRSTTTFLPTNGAINASGNSGIADTQSITRDISTEFAWTASERLEIKGALQWVDSTSNRWSYDMFPTVAFPTAFSIDLTGDLPEVSLPVGPNQLQNGNWNAVMDNYADNEGDLFAANLDFDFKISEEGFFRSVGFGARYGDRSELDWNSGFNWQALGVGWNGSPIVPLANSQPGDAELVNWGDFFRGDLNLPGTVRMPSMDIVERFNPIADHRTYGGTPGEAFRFNPFDRTEGTTTNTAAYVMVRFDGGDRQFLGGTYKGNIGARVVRIENESLGYFTQASGQTFERDGVRYTLGSFIGERSGSTETTRVLPSINFTFSPTDTLQWRVAYNITMDQPSFSALRASGNVGVNTSTQGPGVPPLFNFFTTNDAGNPFLSPVISHNSDISLEWYPTRGSSSAHLALFHKSIDNWITYGAARQPVEIVYAAPVAEIRPEEAQGTNVFNSAESATVKGIEIGGRHFFDSLPGIWSGLGVEANYTYVDSENPGDRYFDIDGVARFDAPVQGLSQDNYNATALFEKGQLSLRLAWSWRSKYLQSTNSNGTNGSYNYYAAPGAATTAVFKDIALPVYGDAYGQLDFGTTYRPTDQLSLSLELSNLTNEITHTLQGGYPGGENIRSWYVADRRANLSVRFNF